MKIVLEFKPVEISIPDKEIADSLRDHLATAIDSAVSCGVRRFYSYNGSDSGPYYEKLIDMVEESLASLDDKKLTASIKKRLTTRLTNGIVSALTK